MTDDIIDWLDERIAFLDQAGSEGAEVADVEEAFQTVRRFARAEKDDSNTRTIEVPTLSPVNSNTV